MTSTPNKNFNDQATASNVGTWGLALNQNFTAIDLNLGGRKNANVAGSANITVSTADAQNVFHLLTGLLTGNINYILPALGGFYFVQNNTTGAFTVTATIAGGSGGVLVPQGQIALVFANPDTPALNGVISTIFTGGITGGSANAQTLASVTPAPWALATSNIIYCTAGATNNGATTFAGPDGVAKSVKKNSSAGLAALVGGEIATGALLFLFWDGTEYILLNPTPVPGQIPGAATNDTAAFGNIGEYTSISVASGAAVALTNGVSANVGSFLLPAGDWDVWINAQFTGGAATVVNYLQASISQTSATLDTSNGAWDIVPCFASTVFNNSNNIISDNVGPLRVSLAAPTTIYFVARAAFTTSTCAAYGIMQARRRR